jgi:hypothetical protein
VSWEEMSKKDYPCPCGKGIYTDILEMNDFNRTREDHIMNCEECKKNYRWSTKQIGYKPYYTYDEGWILKKRG